jgi:hypothetical protein
MRKSKQQIIKDKIAIKNEEDYRYVLYFNNLEPAQGQLK